MKSMAANIPGEYLDMLILFMQPRAMASFALSFHSITLCQLRNPAQALLALRFTYCGSAMIKSKKSGSVVALKWHRGGEGKSRNATLSRLCVDTPRRKTTLICTQNIAEA